MVTRTRLNITLTRRHVALLALLFEHSSKIRFHNPASVQVLYCTWHHGRYVCCWQPVMTKRHMSEVIHLATASGVHNNAAVDDPFAVMQ